MLAKVEGGRRARKARTREVILDVAKRLFEERGYEATTMRDVASAAGIAPGTIFVHFPDKGSLLIEALLDDFARVDPALFETMPEGLENRVMHMVGGALDYWTSRPELSRVMIREMWRVGGEAGARYRAEVRDLVARAAAVLDEAKGREIREDVDTTLVAQSIYDVQTMVLMRHVGDGQLDREAILDEIRRFVRMLTRGIG